jgi:hypothetical protein
VSSQTINTNTSNNDNKQTSEDVAHIALALGWSATRVTNANLTPCLVFERGLDKIEVEVAALDNPDTLKIVVASLVNNHNNNHDNHGPHCIVAAIREQTAAIREQTAAFVRENTIAVNAIQNGGESELLKYLRLQSEERRVMFVGFTRSTDRLTDTIANVVSAALNVERERLSKMDSKHAETMKGIERLAALAAEQGVAFKGDLAALTKRTEGIEAMANLRADSWVQDLNRLDARLDRIEGDCEEGTRPVTNGQLYGEITDLKIEMDNAHARDLDAIKSDMEKIKTDLRILFDDRT